MSEVSDPIPMQPLPLTDPRVVKALYHRRVLDKEWSQVRRGDSDCPQVCNPASAPYTQAFVCDRCQGTGEIPVDPEYVAFRRAEKRRETLMRIMWCVLSEEELEARLNVYLDSLYLDRAVCSYCAGDGAFLLDLMGPPPK